MLRNLWRAYILHPFSILNEVLSLNAQEYPFHVLMPFDKAILNEVLSLNAQESPTGPRKRGRCKSILNEVLSLNAQE